MLINREKHRERNTPVRLFILTISSIILSHFLIGIFVKFLPHTKIWPELLIDTVLLSIIVFPIIYFFVFKPLTFRFEEVKKNNEEILKLHLAVESSGEAVFITNRDGFITYINKEFTNLYGFTSDEVIEKCTPRILKSTRMSAEDYVLFWQSILNKQPVRGELVNKTKDGRYLTIESSVNPILNRNNDIIGFIGIQHDISARKHSEMESQILFDISRYATTTATLDEFLELVHISLSTILYAENCFVALYDEITSRFSFPYFIDKRDSKPMPSAMAKSCTAYVFRTNRPLLLTNEIFYRLKEQNEVELVGTSSPSWIGIPLHTPSKVIGVLVLQHYEKENVYSEADLKLLVSIGNQISVSLERKLAEEEILLKNELLQTINSEKDKFFSILAHDLRGPLSAFVSVTQILTENIKSMTKDEIEDISISMNNDASNIFSLLENLLEWSRLKRGIMEFQLVRFNLNEGINSSARVLSGIASVKGINVVINVPENLEIVADNHMFNTIVRNLVSNAVKFSFSGGTIEISGYRNSVNSIEIRISDSGIGMPAELKNRLFKMNENSGRKGTKGEASSGLGLLLCKEFIDKHNGKIWAESEEGSGSIFYFSLPERSDR